MRRLRALPACLLGMFAASVAAAQDGPVFELEIRRHASTPLTEAEADRILRDAGGVAARVDGPNDVSCPVTLSRLGPVNVFDFGDGAINSRSEFLDVNNGPGNVKVVRELNWCGAIAPNVIGCAPVPGRSLVVVRIAASLEGILWLHEYAHNKGRSHRNQIEAVMFPSIGSNRRSLNAEECAAIQAAPSAATGPLSGGEDPISFDGAAPPVGEYVRGRWVHGLPFELTAETYGPDDVPALLNILESRSRSEDWANAATALAIIGNARAANYLIRFIERPEPDDLSAPARRAKTAAIIALGYLVNRTASPLALGYLLDRAEVANWRGIETVPPLAPGQPAAARRADLGEHAVLGLALSGNARAHARLNAMLAPSGDPEQEAFQIRARALIQQCVNVCSLVGAQGLERYYEGREEGF